ncbi:MAG: GNAT family N-acetyltransferase [Elainellaceae cyanobacterium]
MPVITSPQIQTMNVNIRLATYADIPMILDIYNEAVLNTTASYDYQPNTLEKRTAWYEDHLRKKLPVFVAEGATGRVVGWSALSSFRHAEGYCFSAEDSVYVAADQRGKGIGKLLMPPLIEAAQGLGLHTIVAGIDAANTVSLRLHVAFGFEQVGYLKEVAYKFDRWLDLVLMQKVLK